MPLYAVGLNKGWVEVREAPAPPKSLTSKITRSIKIPADVVNPLTGAYGGTHELVLKVISWDGGKVIGLMPRTSYTYWANASNEPYPEVGGMVPLGQKMSDLFNNAAWRKLRKADPI